LDKTADVIRFGILFPIIGYLAFKKTGDEILPIIAGLTPFMLMVQGYTKWLNEAQILKKNVKTVKNTADEKNISKSKTWIFGVLNSLLWPFHECDLTLWIIVLLASDRIKLLVWILFLSQTVAALISVILRMKEAYERDFDAKV
jgi:uncharacterized membrane protein